MAREIMRYGMAKEWFFGLPKSEKAIEWVGIAWHLTYSINGR